MSRFLSSLFSLRGIAAFTLLTFLPSAVSAWEFFPNTTITVAAAQSSTRSISLLSQDELEEITKRELPRGRSLEKASAAPPIPGATELIERFKNENRNRVHIAASILNPGLLPTISSVVSGAAVDSPVAQEAIDTADAFRANGDYAEAALGYMAVMDSHADTAQAHIANKRVTELEQMFVRGEIPMEEVAAYEAGLPSLAQCRTYKSKYNLLAFYLLRGMAAQTMGDAAGAENYLRLTRDGAWNMMQSDRNNGLQVDTPMHFMEAAAKLGPEEHRAAAAQLEEFVRTSEPSLARWASQSTLARYFLRTLNDGGEAYIYGADLLSHAEDEFLKQCLQDPRSYDWTKAWIHLNIADALYNNGYPLEAYERYAYIVATYPGSGEAFHQASYNLPFILSTNYQDYTQAVDLYSQYLAEHPDGPYAARAMWQMATIYYIVQDYATALDLLQDVLDTYPDSAAATGARHTIDYIHRNILAPRRFAKAPMSEQGEPLIQLCGPMAVQALLKDDGINADLHDLTHMAGTTTDGASMLGLMEAAEAYGMLLVGLHAVNPADLETPYIAHLHDNHFVVVSGFDGNDVLIREYGHEPVREPLDSFLRAWNGRALVYKDAPLVAQLLDEETLAASVGGSLGGGGADPNTSACPNRYTPCTDPCGCGPAGGGGGGAGVPSDPCGDDSGGGGDNGGANSPGGNSGSGGNPGGSGGGGGSPGPSVPVVNPAPGDYPGAPSGPLGGGTGRRLQDRIDFGNQIGSIIPYQGAQTIFLKDISFDIKGPMHIQFARQFHNLNGIFRGEANGDEPWGWNIGRGWSHNFNMWLHTTSVTAPEDENAPLGVVFQDEMGNSKVYEYDTDFLGLQVYKRNHKGDTEEESIGLFRNPSTKKWTMTSPSGMQYVFGETDLATADYWGLLEGIHDVKGNVIALTYDASDRLTKIAAPSPDTRTIQFEYSGNFITKAHMKKGAATLLTMQYAYDANDNLTKVTYPDGSSVEYTYGTNEAGTYGGVYYVAGLKFFIASIKEYDSSPTLLRTTTFDYTFDEYPGPEDALFPYEVLTTYPNGLQQRVDRAITTGWSDVVVTNEYNSTILTQHEIKAGPGGHHSQEHHYYHLNVANDVDIMRYEYYDNLNDGNVGNDHRLHKIVWPYYGPSDPDNRVFVEYDYTGNGRVKSEKFGTLPATTWAYEDIWNQHPTSRTDPTGLTTTYEYDAKKRLVKEVLPWSGANGYQRTFHTSGDIASVVNPNNKATSWLYTAYGKISKTTNALGDEFLMQYDDFGNLTRHENPEGEVYLFEYEHGGCQCAAANNGRLKKVTDPAGFETHYQYDNRGNLTDIIYDPTGVNRKMEFEYDAFDMLTKVIDPAGTGIDTEYTYDKLGRVTSVTDVNGTVTTIAYDHMGRPEEVSSGGATVTTVYDEVGNVVSVTDDKNQTTAYTYNYNNQLAQITDAAGNKVAYQYDSYGRLQKTGGGVSATFHPTSYTYDATEGLLTKVSYDDGATVKDAEYEYDNLARVTRILDWIDDVNGIEYQFDDANRLTKVVDYDGTESVSYAYDGAGRVTSMTDTHGGVTATTSYTYDLRGLLDTLTAPGNKTWDIDYNDLGQPTDVTLPNGMVTEYGYDSRDRMVSIAHKESAAGSVLQSFDYDLDDGGLIDRIDQAGGSWWEYEYDTGYRLTKANRHNKPTSPTITATYEYTYDDADNLTQKVMPWEDDFGDGVVADDGWNVHSGTWSVVDGAATNTKSAGGSILQFDQTDGTAELRFSARVDSSSDTGYLSRTAIRYQNGGEKIELRMSETGLNLYQLSNSTWTLLDSSTSGLATDTWYDFRAVVDGPDIEVWMRERDGSGPFTKELETSSATVVASNKVNFDAQAGSVFGFDNVGVIADGLDRTTTFAVNSANELTSMTDFNGTTSFAYDELGRMTSRTRGGHSATYTWHYDDRLVEVDSNFPGQGLVAYDYGGDGKRRTRTHNSATTTYNWAGFTVTGEENASGALTRSYVGRNIAQIDGANPATGTPAYFTHDHLTSTRAAYDGSKAELAEYEFTPYGLEFLFDQSELTNHLYTGHGFDSTVDHYFAPFRYYSFATGTWLSEDPLNMVDSTNLYSYAIGNPIAYWDPLGQSIMENLRCMASPESKLISREGIFLNASGLFQWLLGSDQPRTKALDKSRDGLTNTVRNLLNTTKTKARKISRVAARASGVATIASALAYSYDSCAKLNSED